METDSIKHNEEDKDELQLLATVAVAHS